MELAKRKQWKFKVCITWSKKHLNVTQKSAPTTNERTIISEIKYFLSSMYPVSVILKICQIWSNFDLVYLYVFVEQCKQYIFWTSKKLLQIDLKFPAPILIVIRKELIYVLLQNGKKV